MNTTTPNEDRLWEQLKRSDASFILTADLLVHPEVTLSYLSVHVLPLLTDMAGWIGRAPRDQIEGAELSRLQDRVRGCIETLTTIDDWNARLDMPEVQS